MNIKYNYIYTKYVYRLIYYHGLWLRSILNTIESFKSKLTWFGCIYVDIRKLDPTLLTFPCGKASYLIPLLNWRKVLYCQVEYEHDTYRKVSRSVP